MDIKHDFLALRTLISAGLILEVLAVNQLTKIHGMTSSLSM